MTTQTDSLISIRVYLADGTDYVTSVNGSCSQIDIARYFVGTEFNFGIEDDRLIRCRSIRFLRDPINGRYLTGARCKCGRLLVQWQAEGDPVACLEKCGS